MTNNMEIANRRTKYTTNVEVQNIFLIIEQNSHSLTTMLYVSFVPWKTIENQNE